MRLASSLLISNFLSCIFFSLTSCSSVQPIGTLGPKKLSVYSISSSTFLNSSQMLVILNRKGDIAAYTGGTVAGWGSVALQAGGNLLSAGAIVYGAKEIQTGLENAPKNLPQHFTVEGDLGISDETIDKLKS